MANPARVSSSATTVNLLSEDGSRQGVSIFNESTAVLYVKKGASASATDYNVQIAAGGYFESPANSSWGGLITGVWASANGAAQVGYW